MRSKFWLNRIFGDQTSENCYTCLKFSSKRENSALFMQIALKRISGECDDFENFDAEKCDLGKTCCAWSEKSVLYNFHEKRTVFPFWREFEASVTIFTTLTLTSAIWPKGAAHDLKRGFCTIFMKSALFSLFGENWGQCDAHKCDFAKTCWACPKKNVLYNFHRKRTVFPFWREFRPVWRFWQLWR